jgi:methylase of polypeptide subunit release factors
MSKSKEVAVMSTDELLAAMRELLPKDEAPKVIDFTGVGTGVVVTATAHKADRAAVKAAMTRIDEYESAIRSAERTYREGEYHRGDHSWGMHSEAVRDARVEAARRAIVEEYEALNLRLNVHARLHEHGLLG